jgi:hypothetical protein
MALPAAPKQEFPPLLTVGFHEHTLAQLRAVTVDAFPLSKSRGKLMSSLEDVHSKLTDAGVTADLWADGSFLTKKIDPLDIDVVLEVAGDQYDSGTADQQLTIRWFASQERQVTHCIHSFVCVKYPPGHKLHSHWQWQNAYWIRQFGFSRMIQHKGMALIKIP